MFCKTCGRKIEEDLKFCPECGTPLKDTSTQSEAQYGEGAVQSNEAPVINNTNDKSAERPVFVFGLLSLIISLATWLPLLSLIFGIVAKSKHKKLIAGGGTDCGKARTGRKLATAGIIISIIAIVLLVICFAIVAACGDEVSEIIEELYGVDFSALTDF